MKIAFWLPHLKVAGGIRTSLTYAHLLHAFGHEVDIVVADQRGLLRLVATWLNLKPTWMRGLYLVRVRRFKTITAQTFNSYDVVVADSWPIAKHLAVLDIPGKKVHFVQHDERLYHGASAEVATVYRLPLKKIVISTWLKEIFARDFNQDSHLVLTSFDQQIFHPVAGIRPEGVVRVLVLDHLYNWKGTAEGAAMVLKLKQKYSQVRLIGFGVRRVDPDIPYDEYHFNPPQEKLAELYSSCHIYLCPSWEEGFGMPSLEAMACGTALVTYDNGGARDFAHDGETALVAPHRDQVSLQAKLAMLIADKNLWAKIAVQGYALAKSWPTWEEQARRFETELKN